MRLNCGEWAALHPGPKSQSLLCEQTWPPEDGACLVCSRLSPVLVLVEVADLQLCDTKVGSV